MQPNQIKISVREEVENTGNAIAKVTKAILGGAPGSAGRIKGKRKSAQVTLRVKDAGTRGEIQKTARERIMEKVFIDNAIELENEIRAALTEVVIGLTGYANGNIRVFGSSLGSARSTRPLDQESFISFIKSPAGAGEIGLPDPEESIRNLKIALINSIVIDVVVRSNGPQIQFRFDQRKLLRLTPHPDLMEGGARPSFYSWLSLITGPDLITGTPGFALVRAKDIISKLYKIKKRQSKSRISFGALKSVKSLQTLISASRTRSNAGAMAGLMLSTQRRQAKSQAEFAGGENIDYKTSKRYDHFWDSWWADKKVELETWSRRIMLSAIRNILRRG